MKGLKKGILSWICLLSIGVFAQGNLLPMHSFYKNKFLKHSGKQSIETFFPANESQLNLNHFIRDSSKNYYDVTEWLFKKHWIELRKDNAYLYISPMADIRLGKEQIDTSTTTLFRNTRGVWVNGGIGKKLSFQFTFAENQARFMQYEAAYFTQQGEIKVGSAGYYRENATIPGAARTKPFKVDGFDYAYSIGVIRYEISKKMSLEAGNNQLFIGTGYRSLLLSDNAIPAPHLRFKWQFAPRWDLQIVYQKNSNQYRKPSTNAVEAPYESKFYAANYLTFKPVPNIALSLFTAGNQLRQDSIQVHKMEAQMWIPLPGMQNDLLFGNSSVINGISGLNIDIALDKNRIYGQFVVDKLANRFLTAGQIGAHFFDCFQVQNLHMQLELNYVPKSFYADENPKLSYNQYNIPAAHPKGNNFGEIIYLIDYELKRFTVESKSILMTNQGIGMTTQFAPNSIFTSTVNAPDFGVNYGTTFLQEFEIGYRLNRKYNAQITLGVKIRSSEFAGEKALYQAVLVGFKTGIMNQYFDF